MYAGCTSLVTIYVSDKWNTEHLSLDYGRDVFAECNKIVGGNGTIYDANHVDYSYAIIDGGTENPGYFTEKGSPSVIPITKQAYAVYDNGELKFYYDKHKEDDTHSDKTIYDITDGSNPGWFSIASELTSVVFDSSFKDYTGLTTLAGWFSQCVNLSEIEGLENLNTTEVTSMKQMFLNCQELTSLDVSHFETSKVTDMSGMFSWCKKLKSVVDLSNFDTSNVTNMGTMFEETRPSEIIFGSKLNTTNLTSYLTVFKMYSPKQITFTGDVPSGLDKDIFSGIGSEESTCYLNVPEKFKENYRSKFVGNTFFGGYFHLDIPKVMYAEFDNGTLTFYYKEEKTGSNVYPIVAQDGLSSSSGWIEHKESIKKVVFDASFADARPIATDCWFSDCGALEEIEGLEYLNTSEVVNMESMFAVCGKVSVLDISNFNTSKVKNMNTMFADCASLTTIFVGEDWNTESVTSSEDMFTNSTKLVGGKGTAYDANHTDASYAHIDGGSSNPGYLTREGDSPYVPVSSKEPYAVLSADNKTLTFYYDENKASRNGMGVGPFEFSYKTGVNSGWYEQRENITSVVFDVSFSECTSITSTARWFYHCTNLAGITDIQNLKTDNVTDMRDMFCQCSSLVTLDLSHFNTANVTNMSEMFVDCKNLTTIDLSYFNTANVTDMRQMFSGCSNLENIIFGNFDTSSIVTLEQMFGGCRSLRSLDLSSFNTPKLTTLTFMFNACYNLTTIYVGEGWSTEKVKISKEMFTHCTNLIGGKGTRYNDEWIDHSYARIDGGKYNPGYFTQAGQAPYDPEDDIIDFKDAEVKRICVENWDTSGDGEISYKEAKAVTNLNKKFAGNKIIESFDELQYFTGLKALDYQEGGQFDNCEKLETITLPEGLEKIGEATFNYCRALKAINIPASVTDMSYLGGWYEEMTTITVATGNTVYDSRGGCNAVIEIASNTLISGCNKTVIPSTVTSIGDFAFNSCVTDSIVIPGSVKTIGKSAFVNCKFTGVGLPASITSIDEAAFAGCTNIKHVTSDIANPFGIADNTFADIVYETAILWVPSEDAVAKYGAADGWKKFKNIKIMTVNVSTDDDNDHQNFFSADYTPYGTDGVEVSKVDDSEGDVEIPTKITIKGEEVPVTSIAEGAFADNTALTSVTVPSNVTNIGDGAFSGCTNLEYLDLSAANIPNISANAISGLSDETVVVLPEAMSATNAQTLSEASTNIVYKDGSEYKSANVKLTDGEKYNAPASIISIKVAKVNYPRSFSNDDVVYSICLPYDQPIPTGMKAYELEEFNSNNLVFKQVSSIEAMKPYLIKTSTSVDGLSAQIVTMSLGGNTTDTEDVAGYDFCGSLKRIPNSEANGCLILQSDKSWHPVGAKDIPANRAYLKQKSTNAARIVGTIFVDDFTGITTIDLDGTESYYDLQGRRISKPTKAGIYVKAGRKTVVK